MCVPNHDTIFWCSLFLCFIFLHYCIAGFIFVISGITIVTNKCCNTLCDNCNKNRPYNWNQSGLLTICLVRFWGYVCYNSMDFLKEGGSVSHPSFLDGYNYSYCKVHMKAFIKAIDGKA